MQSMMRKGEKKVIWKYFCINHDLLTSFQTKNKLEKEGTTFAQILKPAAKVNKNNFILRLKNKKISFFCFFKNCVPFQLIPHPEKFPHFIQSTICLMSEFPSFSDSFHHSFNSSHPFQDLQSWKAHEERDPSLNVKFKWRQINQTI
jgi:hypothetical protein